MRLICWVDQQLSTPGTNRFTSVLNHKSRMKNISVLRCPISILILILVAFKIDLVASL
jgi:hypothetical protein